MAGEPNTPPPDLFPEIQSEVKKLECYSGLYCTYPRIYYPDGEDELLAILTKAAEKKCNLTFRAGGHSFDSQSLGSQYAVSMRHFDGIGEVQAGDTLRVEAGACWGAVVAKLEPLGLLPKVTVTTCRATPGGTLAGDCLSRFSPAYGKEGTWIRSFEMLTLDGKRLTCEAPLPTKKWPDMTLEERAFCGVISGLGYLGAVVAITYQLHGLEQRHGPIGVRTSVRKFTDHEKFVEELVDTTRTMYFAECSPNSPTDDAIYSSLYTGRRGKPQQALLFVSSLTPDTERRRMLIYQPKLRSRVLIEWLQRRPLLARASWRLFFGRIIDDKRPYVDNLDDFTFFMDGNVRAKEIGKRWRFKMQTIQQTFVVPFDPKSGKWGDGREALSGWLRYAEGVFRRRKVAPTLWDVMFLPDDTLFRMSATTRRAGFAVSYAFETSSERRLARIKAAFVELSDHLWNTYKGRVYLVKNVHANETTLAEMYGQDAIEFFALKRELDPDCVFRNEFLERTFPDLLPAECQGPLTQTVAVP